MNCQSRLGAQFRKTISRNNAATANKFYLSMRHLISICVCNKCQMQYAINWNMRRKRTKNQTENKQRANSYIAKHVEICVFDYLFGLNANFKLKSQNVSNLHVGLIGFW